MFVRVGARLEAPWVSGDLRFGFPVHTWDSWMILGALAAEPVAKNRDGSIPQKWLKPVASRLVPVPEWWGMGSHPEQRVMSALLLLDTLGALARQRGDVSDWNRWAISTKGSLLHRGGRTAFFQQALECGCVAEFDLQTDQMMPGLRDAVEMALWSLKGHGVHEPGVGRLVKRRVMGVVALHRFRPAEGRAGSLRASGPLDSGPLHAMVRPQDRGFAGRCARSDPSRPVGADFVTCDLRSLSATD
ncbi:MAG: hypothetical protein IPN71_05945 [Fibrobacteres bacterium]|nr:hypothetical protein [Fibrobacterota bacterium]